MESPNIVKLVRQPPVNLPKSCLGELKECLNGVNQKLKVLNQRADQNGELFRNISDRSVEAQRRTDTIGAQSGELLSVTTGLTMKLEDMSKSLHELDARMTLRMRALEGH